MSTISSLKSAQQKWTPLFIFDVVLKDGTPRYWSTQAVTFGGNSYTALVLEHSSLKVQGEGVYGVDAVQEITLVLNNADANLNSLLAPTNWQGGTIQPFFIFIDPDTGNPSSDSITYPKFLIDLPTETWPRVVFQCHNKWNLARKELPLSKITKKDRYPFPNTAAERTAAGSDVTSEYFACGYDPANGKGNWKTPPSTPYLRADYNGTRDVDGPGSLVSLKTIGLEIRYGGFGKIPPTSVGTPRKGERVEYVGNANEGKYGQAVPLLYGTVRVQPIVLDTGFPESWNGSRLSHMLLCDGVNFGPEATMGIEGVVDPVWLPDVKGKTYRVFENSPNGATLGTWNLQGGYFGSQKDTGGNPPPPALDRYRNIDGARDYGSDPKGDHKDRDLYSGLAFIEIVLPKELSGTDGLGPRVEAIVKGLKVETWGNGPGFSVTWQWTDNPVWIFVDLLKRLGWSVANDIDKQSAYDAATFCDGLLANNKKRFRCGLALTQATKASDVLRGIRNNCRLSARWGNDGKLQLSILRDLAGEGGSAFTLDSTNIARGEDGRMLVSKFHKSVFETANIFNCQIQDEENNYVASSVSKVGIDNVNQINEKIPADSIAPILGIISFDQAERQLEWLHGEYVTLNEYYRVTATLGMIENRVGQIGTITETRHGLSSQQCRIVAIEPGNAPGTVDLVLKKHSDGVYTDQSTSTPLVRALNDSTYSPRSVGGTTGTTGNPTLVESFVNDPNTNMVVRKITASFTPPPTTYENGFTEKTKISALAVQTTGGSIAGNQKLFVEVCPRLGGVDGLPSEYLLANIPTGTSTNKFTFTCELPAEATHYTVRVGTYPGRLFEQAVAASPGTAPFTVTVSSISALESNALSPDPNYDHAMVLYKFNNSLHWRVAGKTTSPGEGSLIFEPETPGTSDTSITVAVLSSNHAEDDFYPINISPQTTLTLTKDTAVPTIPTIIGANWSIVANGTILTIGLKASANARSVALAKFRIKRLPDNNPSATTLDLRNAAEGGSDTDLIQIDDYAANVDGSRLTITVDQPGRYFVAGTLKNLVGWGSWTSGDAYATGPQNTPVAHSINTTLKVDAGPPEGWTVTTEAGPDPNSVVVRVTRPTTNGNNLLYLVAQVKDSSTGSWRAINENAGASVIKYEGSAIGHKLNDGGYRVTRESGSGFGTAVVGDLVILDVRGGSFHRNYCQWATVKSFEGGNPATATYFDIGGGFRPQAFTDVRIQICTPPWDWTSEGYLGAQANDGMSWRDISDPKFLEVDEFVLGPIKVEADVSVDARVWFENAYSRSDASTPANPPTVSSNSIQARKTRDQINSYVTGPAPGGTFANFDKWIVAASPDSQSSLVVLFWDYTQHATNKATQFAISITDGTASFIYRVRAIQTAGAQKHRVVIKRLHKNKAVTVGITPEFVAANGLVPGTQETPAAWSFTPSSTSGSDLGGTLVGEMDWAGGNVWFDTDQFRNNLAPTNAPSGLSVGANVTEEGCRFVDVTWSYTQGANIATHFAIYIKKGGGTIATSDFHYLVSAGAGTTITMAFGLPPATYSFGVSAVAMTRTGPSYNGTMASINNSTIANDDPILFGGSRNLRLQANSTFQLASGAILDVNFGPGTFKPKKSTDSNNPPAAPSMSSGELIFFDANHVSVSRRFLVYYDGTNRFYFEAGGTGGTNLF